MVRGGRSICLTEDRTVALLIAENKEERIRVYSNYRTALGWLSKLTTAAVEHSEPPKGDFIHLDVSVHKETGSAEFRVMIADKVIVTGKYLRYCNSNLAEYLALVEAHKYANHYRLKYDIYCDNTQAINWFSRVTPLSVPPTVLAANPYIGKCVTAAGQYIDSLPPGYANNVKFWDSSMWGEIPSDYGRKKV